MIISSYLIYAQLDNAGKYSALLRTVDVCVQQAQDVLSTPQMDISGRDISPEHCDISAENISFAYEQKKIIVGVSLRIPEHTATAIVGPSGGGKTTLTSLLSRFWGVDEGKLSRTCTLKNCKTAVFSTCQAAKSRRSPVQVFRQCSPI